MEKNFFQKPPSNAVFGPHGLPAPAGEVGLLRCSIVVRSLSVRCPSIERTTNGQRTDNGRTSDGPIAFSSGTHSGLPATCRAEKKYFPC